MQEDVRDFSARIAAVYSKNIVNTENSTIQMVNKNAQRTKFQKLNSSNKPDSRPKQNKPAILNTYKINTFF